jgi:cytochrome P450
MDEWNNDQTIELFPMMAELTIRTASACLMGKEIRDQLHSDGTYLFYPFYY